MTSFVFLTTYVGFAFGLAYILGHSVISRPLREWAYKSYLLRWLVLLVECPACCGFWIGLVFSFIATRLIYRESVWLDLAFALFAGCFTACSNFIIGRATGVIARPATPKEGED